MIVEIFFKGTNFTEHCENLHNISAIQRNGDWFCFMTEDGRWLNPSYNANEYELRITY